MLRGLVRSPPFREMSPILATGLVLGVAAAALVGRVLGAALYDMQPWDPIIFGGAVALMGLIAFAAAYLPARRASAVDPIVALRIE